MVSHYKIRYLLTIYLNFIFSSVHNFRCGCIIDIFVMCLCVLIILMESSSKTRTTTCESLNCVVANWIFQIFFVINRKNANAAVRDRDGLLALHHAVLRSHLQIVEMLLSYTSALTVCQRYFSVWQCWQYSIMVRMLVLNLSCVVLVFDCDPTLWVNHPLSVSHVSLPSLWGRQLSSIPFSYVLTLQMQTV